MIVEKPVLKLFLRSVTTGSNSEMNQSGFLLVQSAGKIAHTRCAGFVFSSNWLKSLRAIFKAYPLKFYNLRFYER